MKEVDYAYHFWKRIDEIREISLIEIADRSGIAYNLIKTQRSKNRLPKTLEAVAIAKTVNTSVEWLIYGERTAVPDKTLRLVWENKRLYGIAKVLTNAPDRHLDAMEVLLNINPENSGVGKSMA